MSTAPPFNEGDLVQVSPDGPPLPVIRCQHSADGRSWEVVVKLDRIGKNQALTVPASEVEPVT